MKRTLSLALALFCHSWSPACAADLNQIFRKTLVMGASVSRGLVTQGPGTRAAKRYGGTVKNIAEDSKPASDYGEDLDEGFLQGYTALVAIDLLFWDSSHLTIGKSTEVVDQLLEEAEEKGIPVILGDIPALLEWYKQMSRGRLNSYIHERCRQEKKCYIVPFERLHQVAKDSGLMINGKSYRFDQLADDGLHMNKVGSEYVADLIVELLQKGSVTIQPGTGGGEGPDDDDDDEDDEDDDENGDDEDE